MTPTMTEPSRRIRRGAAGLACVLLLTLGVAACGSDSNTSTQSPGSTTGQDTGTTAAESGGSGF